MLQFSLVFIHTHNLTCWSVLLYCIGTELPYCKTDTLQCCTKQSLVEDRRYLGDSLLGSLVDEIDKNENRLDYINDDFRDCMLINNMFIIVGNCEWMDCPLLKVNNERFMRQIQKLSGTVRMLDLAQWNSLYTSWPTCAIFWSDQQFLLLN